jgi:hypothetical protein
MARLRRPSAAFSGATLRVNEAKGLIYSARVRHFSPLFLGVLSGNLVMDTRG